MKYLTWAVIGLAGLLALITVQFATMTALGIMDPEPEWYVVDAPSVVRVFVEERGDDMTEAEMAAAILVFDQLVMDEAQAVFEATGHRLVNSNHVLAGANDVSIQFAHRVVARWDALQ